MLELVYLFFWPCCPWQQTLMSAGGQDVVELFPVTVTITVTALSTQNYNRSCSFAVQVWICSPKQVCHRKVTVELRHPLFQFAGYFCLCVIFTAYKYFLAAASYSSFVEGWSCQNIFFLKVWFNLSFAHCFSSFLFSFIYVQLFCNLINRFSVLVHERANEKKHPF